MQSDRWRIQPRSKVHLDAIDPSATPGAPGDKAATRRASDEQLERLIDLQSRLWAEKKRAFLLVLQAMDAGGKDGAIRRVFSGVNPQGCRATSFREPSAEELNHDFLWRIHRALPARGQIGIFNRSHYEDVIVPRVHRSLPRSTWRNRYPIINEFEQGLTHEGTRVVKVFLHISKEEQAARLQKRLDDPRKRWKFSLGDLDKRARWNDYMAAYEEILERTSGTESPWYVVPANRKRYRDWALLTILVDHLTDLDPRFPEPEEDLDGVHIE